MLPNIILSYHIVDCIHIQDFVVKLAKLLKAYPSKKEKRQINKSNWTWFLFGHSTEISISIPPIR